MSRHREVVFTGCGACCHMGDDWTFIETSLREGRVTPFKRWEEAIEYGAQCELSGLYPHELNPAALGITKQQARFMGRAALLGLRATRLALEQSGVNPKRAAVVVGSGTGDVATHRDTYEKLERSRKTKRVGPTVIPRMMSSTVSANLAMVLESTGPSFSASAACAGGAYNILLAAGMIERGIVETAVAGGVEVKDIHFYAGFDAMRAYTHTDNDRPDKASRPFAADRAGFVFSEGAGIVVLESRETAEARGAKVLGVLRGYGMSSDGGGSMVAPATAGAEQAMRAALADAGVEAGAIDYVNMHATSTPLGDVSEVRAVQSVLAGRHVPYSSTKAYTGHPISAAGALEAIFTLAMMRGSWIAPSANAEPLDPEIEDYPPVVRPMSRQIELALSNSFGFGGTNAALVLGRA